MSDTGSAESIDVDGYWVLESIAGGHLSDTSRGTVRVTRGLLDVEPLTPVILSTKDGSNGPFLLTFMRDDGTRILSLWQSGVASIVIKPPPAG
jgi:hypothetical protein